MFLEYFQILSVKAFFTHTHSCHRPSCSPKYYQSVSVHPCMQGTVHPHPSSLLSICNRPRYSHTAKTTHTQEAVWTRHGKKEREDRGGEEKDQEMKLSDWSIAQKQLLTSEALGFTAVGLGLLEAPESGLCSCPGGLRGEEKDRPNKDVIFESLTPSCTREPTQLSVCPEIH